MAAVEQCAYEAFTSGMENLDTMAMDERVKGTHLRGRKYTVSQDGLCPRCGNSNRLYVILDKLFPMGDMPEILHTLIAKGRAILWSSQEKEGYKDPPTLLCQGFCPPDPLGAGFNVNWSNVTLNEILESLDKPAQKATIPISSHQGAHSQVLESSQDGSSDNLYVLDDFQGNNSELERNTSQASVTQSSSDKEEENDDDEEEEDEEDDDEELDEEELIKQMLAKEQQKLSQANNDDGGGDKNDDRNVHQVVSAATTDSEDFSSQSSSSSNVVTSIPAATASTEQTLSTSTTSTSTKSSSSQYPVSSTGHCPYCGSTDVKYIIVVSENTQDSELPQSLQQLLKSNQAFKMAKGESEPPSFQCQKCQYGFNLNWSKTNLELIFGLPPTTSTAVSSTATSFTSTSSVAYQASYIPHPHYPPPSLPPPGYPLPVRVPPPVPAVPFPGAAPTYPGYYGPYYPPPVGSYPPYTSPTIPLHGIPYPGMPPPGIPPPGIPPPGIPPGVPPPSFHPPRIPPPRISPPGVPLPGVPALGIPSPGVLPSGYPPPAVPPSGAQVWGSYPQSQAAYQAPPYYPPPPARGYLPPPGGRSYYPPQQQLRSPRPGGARPWYRTPTHAAVTSTAAAAVPPQQGGSAPQTAEEEVGEKAAARFEMVLNQIDQAKARVRHEKEQMVEFQKAVHGDQLYHHQQQSEEPNALADEGLKMSDYDEKPPGDDDTEYSWSFPGFGSSVIITESLEKNKVEESSETTAETEPLVSPSQMTPSDVSVPTGMTEGDSNVTAGDQCDVTAPETEAGTRDEAECAITENDDSKQDQNVNLNVAVQETVKTAPEIAGPIRGRRRGRSKKQDESQIPLIVTSSRQTRRSRRSEPTAISEDTDSTATEEEVVTHIGRFRRPRKTNLLNREVQRLDISDDQQQGMQQEETGDTEMLESSDVLSQSSALPQTDSDSTHDVPSESLVSSSEPEVPDGGQIRPQRGRQARGRKRKLETAVAASAIRKSQRLVAEEQQGESKEVVGDEAIVEESVAFHGQEEGTEVPVTSARVGRTGTGASGGEAEQPEPDGSALDTAKLNDKSIETFPGDHDKPTEAADKQEAKVHSKRQTRKAPQLPQEPEAVIQQTNLSTVVKQENEEGFEATEITSNRRTRKSTPRRVSSEADKATRNRRTRKSAQVSPEESEISETEQHPNSDQTGKNCNSQPENNQPEEKQSGASFGEHEDKVGRRTRKTRKSSASIEESTKNSTDTPSLEEDELSYRAKRSRKSWDSSEDATKEHIHLSAEPDTPQETLSSRRTRGRKAKPEIQESNDLSAPESGDVAAQDDVEDKVPVTPRERASKKMKAVKTPETVKRVTRARHKK